METPDEYGENQMFPASWEETALASEDTAFDVIDMVVGFPEWVHRRKERAEIASGARVQIHCSLDFTVPRLGRERTRWLNDREIVLVPIDVLEKQPLIAFDCRDGDGSPVPVLSRRQNGIVAEAAMLHWAATITVAADTPLTRTTAERVADITQGKPAEARALVRELLAGDAPDQRALADDPGFMAMLTWLAGNFLLVAVVEMQPGDRRIIKYSYEYQWPQLARPLTERLGFKPTMMAVPVQMFRECESYHFEAVAPDGTDFAAVALVDNTPLPDGAFPQAHYENLKNRPPVAHVSISRTSQQDSEENPETDAFENPVVILATQLDRDSWLRSGLLVSLFIAAFLTVTTPWILGWRSASEIGEWCLPNDVIVVGPWCMPSPAASGLSGDPAALFVGVVGLLSLVVVRQGEHAYTAKLVRPLRNIVWVISALPVAGGWLIMFPGPGFGTRLLWASLGIVAWCGVATLAVAYWDRADTALSQGPGTVN